jgi:hypothetical protein
MEQERKNSVMQWIKKELSVLNIIALVTVPVTIGFSLSEYKTFKSATEKDIKELKEKADKMKDDVTEIKYNSRYTAFEIGNIKTSIEKLEKTSQTTLKAVQ